MPLNVPGLDAAVNELKAMNSALTGMQATLGQINQNQSRLTTGITTMFAGITKSANQATQAVNKTNAAVGNVSGQGQGNNPMGSSPPPRAGGWQGVKDVVGTAAGSSLIRDMAMFPLRFMQSQIRENRDLALTSATAMGGQSFATGIGMQDIFKSMAGFPGSVYGTPQEMLDLFGIARQAGGMINMGQFGTMPPGAAGEAMSVRGAPRVTGFLEGVRQMQLISPGTPVGQMAQTLGGFSANTQAQQQSQFLTGGSFSMIGMGGRQKSLSEWAESVLRWLEGQRPGGMRGQGFSYGELLTQNFPGSNIDVWFQTNGVPPDMREYWWSYALGKVNKGGKTTAAPILQQGQALPGVVGENVAYQRLMSTSAMTRTGFGLAGQLTGAYANREVANTWFNDLMGQMIQDVIPTALSRGALQFMQFLPDTVEDLLMSMLEKSGVAGTVIGAGLGYGPGVAELLKQSSGGLLGTAADWLTGGDVGDVGDWGPSGARSTAGMHPDMRRKVDAMMAANPRIRINSGMRDRATQMKMRQAGNRNVTGRPSAHTRGFAADLGPRSEYPWIVANAAKFGLSSGARAGEPWHVGLGHDVARGTRQMMGGDVGDITDLAENLFGGLLSPLASVFGLTNPDPDAVIQGIGSIIPTIMALLTGAMGGTRNVVESNLRFRPTLYAELSQRYGEAGTGGGIGGRDRPPARSAAEDDIGGGDFPSSGGGTTGPAGTGGTKEHPTYGNVATSTSSSKGSLADAKKSAQFANTAGFSGADLVTAVAIAGRESGWNEGARNSRTSDRGMWQINMSANMSSLRSAGIADDEADLMQGATNARAAKYLMDRSNGFAQPWGAAATSPHTWVGRSGHPLNGTEPGFAKYAVQQAGFPTGDLEPYYPPPMPEAAHLQQRPPLVFNNTFNIQSGGGGGGGIDVRRTTTLIADHLEEEMKRRMSRSN